MVPRVGFIITVVRRVVYGMAIPLSFLGAIFLLSSCTPRVHPRCAVWRNEGNFFISDQACTECIKRFGESSKEAVLGCGIGYEGADFL
jgi:hypothetical protein